MMIAAITYNVNLFTACFFWAFSGMIAGTIANFVVRGRGGCIFGNIFLGLVGALVATVLINVFLQQKNVTLDFFETTVIASVASTLIAYIFHTARKAESKYQQKLMEKPPR